MHHTRDTHSNYPVFRRNFLLQYVRSWPDHGLCFVASLHNVVFYLFLEMYRSMWSTPTRIAEDEMSPTPATTSVEWSWRLKGCLCSHLGSKGQVKAAFDLPRCPTAVPCWWGLTRPKQLSMAAWGLGQTTGCVLWLPFTILFSMSTATNHASEDESYFILS